MFIDTLNLNCSRFKHCRSIRDQLLNDIQNEWIKLDKLKLHAWQMAPWNGTGHTMPTLSDPGPTTSISDIGSMWVIDTCEWSAQSQMGHKFTGVYSNLSHPTLKCHYFLLTSNPLLWWCIFLLL